MRDSVQRLVDVAKSEGIYVEVKYPNYAVTGTSSEQLYGSANANRLKKIRKQVSSSGYELFPATISDVMLVSKDTS